MYPVSAEDWNAILRHLEQQTSPTQFRTWIAPIHPIPVPAEEADPAGPLVVGCASDKAAQWIEDHYTHLVEEAMESVFGEPREVIFVRRESTTTASPEPATVGAPVTGAMPGYPGDGNGTGEGGGATGLPARQLGGRGWYTIAGPANEPAYATTAATPADTQPVSSSILPVPGPQTQTAPSPVPVTVPTTPVISVPPQPEPAAISYPNGGNTIPLNPHHTFDTFVEGKCNRMARVTALTVADSPGTRYNPLFFYGSVGLGKTHLLHAIAHKLQQDRPDFRILCKSCEAFLTEYIQAVEQRTLDRFQAYYRSLDCLILDDIHYLVEKDRTQEEFFHTFNALQNAEKQIVLSSDTAPTQMQGIEHRLISRFTGGPAVEIEPPDFETRVTIFKRKALARGLNLDQPVLHYLAEQFTHNVREMEGAVNLLDAAVAFIEEGKELTITDAERILSDVVEQKQGPKPPLSMELIAKYVCEYYGVKLKDLQSKRRTKSIALPRQICMHIASQRTELTLSEIGAFFGGRDHSTVIHALRKIEAKINDDPTFRGLLQSFGEALDTSER